MTLREKKFKHRVTIDGGCGDGAINQKDEKFNDIALRFSLSVARNNTFFYGLYSISETFCPKVYYCFGEGFL